MAWCIMNSYRSGCCACGKLLKGQRFEPQRSKRLSQQSPQQALCHEAKCTETVRHQPNGLFGASIHAEQNTDRTSRVANNTSNGRFRHDYLSKHMVWPTSVAVYSDCSVHSDWSQQSDSYPTVNQHDSRWSSTKNFARSIWTPCSNSARIWSHHPPTCCACPNATVSSHSTVLSSTTHLTTHSHESWGRERRGACRAVKQQWKL